MAKRRRLVRRTRRRRYGVRRIRRRLGLSRRLRVRGVARRRWRGRRYRRGRVSMRRLPPSVRPEVKAMGKLGAFFQFFNTTVQTVQTWVDFPPQGTGLGQRVGNKFRNYLTHLWLRDFRIGQAIMATSTWLDDTLCAQINQNAMFRVLVIKWHEQRERSSLGGVYVPPVLSEIMEQPAIEDFWRSKLKKPASRSYTVMYDRKFKLVKESTYSQQAVAGIPGAVTTVSQSIIRPRDLHFKFRQKVEFEVDPITGQSVDATRLPQVYIVHNITGTDLVNKNVLAFDSEIWRYFTDA